ncbi:TRAP transporter substrate-binding protein [Limnohabitans sp. INBF002]|uniref:TRAP transporter substrate-binding protein n=1 Tax=Limnohabitans sp. INBF002 TaxID=2986280 RepID=UPI002376DF49|nr:TRAP transporter substrate-binding protein [Limnohabitans sp. INBF002]BDU53511.1 C4-dicarboxylate ABC transporter [Limnohabitans sp. INBF002]
MKTRFLKVAAAAAFTAAALGQAASAQEVTLKVHHFLPASSFAQTLFIQPWCDRIAKESNNKMKCQIYPSMQLGGSPPQLFEQARDGVADVIWTLPGYTAGRFPSIEVFELPFMMQSPEATSKALWDYVDQYAKPEFKDVKPLAFHVHADGVFHMTNKPIRTAADLKGMKLRAPTRMTTKFLGLLGATPVPMPVPQVGDALSKGVIDGAALPYEVMPAMKIQELVKFHSETDPAEPAFYTSTFIFAMNQAKYDSLSPELKKVIDRNSGQSLSGIAGKAFLQADIEGKKLTTKNTTNVIPKAELENWKKIGQPLADAWVADMNAKGQNGKQMLEGAKALIAKHAAGK